MKLLIKTVSVITIICFALTNISFAQELNSFKLAAPTKFGSFQGNEFRCAAKIHAGVLEALQKVPILDVEMVRALGPYEFVEKTVFGRKIKGVIRFDSASEYQLDGGRITIPDGSLVFRASTDTDEQTYYCLVSKYKVGKKYNISVVPGRVVEDALKRGVIKFTHGSVDKRDQFRIDNYLSHEITTDNNEAIDPWIAYKMATGNYAVSVSTGQTPLYAHVERKIYDFNSYVDLLNDVMEELRCVGVKETNIEKIKDKMLRTPFVLIPYKDENELPVISINGEKVKVRAHSSPFANYGFIPSAMYSEAASGRPWPKELKEYMKDKFFRHEIGMNCGLKATIEDGRVYNILDAAILDYKDIKHSQKNPVVPREIEELSLVDNLFDLELHNNDYAAGEVNRAVNGKSDDMVIKGIEKALISVINRHSMENLTLGLIKGLKDETFDLKISESNFAQGVFCFEEAIDPSKCKGLEGRYKEGDVSFLAGVDNQAYRCAILQRGAEHRVIVKKSTASLPQRVLNKPVEIKKQDILQRDQPGLKKRIFKRVVMVAILAVLAASSSIWAYKTYAHKAEASVQVVDEATARRNKEWEKEITLSVDRLISRLRNSGTSAKAFDISYEIIGKGDNRGKSDAAFYPNLSPADAKEKRVMERELTLSLLIEASSKEIHPLNRYWMLFSIGHIPGNAETVSYLGKVLYEDSDGGCRAAAAMGLTFINFTEDSPVLYALKNHASFETRLQIAFMLRRSGGSYSPIKYLLERVIDEDENVELRAMSIDSIWDTLSSLKKHKNKRESYAKEITKIRTVFEEMLKKGVKSSKIEAKIKAVLEGREPPDMVKEIKIMGIHGENSGSRMTLSMKDDVIGTVEIAVIPRIENRTNVVGGKIAEALWNAELGEKSENDTKKEIAKLAPEVEQGIRDKWVQLAAMAANSLGVVGASVKQKRLSKYPTPGDNDIRSIAPRITDFGVKVYMQKSCFPGNTYAFYRQQVEAVRGKLVIYQNVEDLDEMIDDPDKSIVMNTYREDDPRREDTLDLLQSLKLKHRGLRVMNFESMEDIDKMDDSELHNYLTETLSILMLSRIITSEEYQDKGSPVYRMLSHLLEDYMPEGVSVENYIESIVSSAARFIKTILRALPVTAYKMMKRAVEVLWSA